ncbi:hypothetical protein JCM19992_04940 [Thermostilla marina]
MVFGASVQVVHARPAGQLQNASQIAARLFPAYRLDGGTVQLAGCALEDHLFVRLKVRLADDREEIYFADAQAKLLEPLQVDGLGLRELETGTEPPEGWSVKRLDRLWEVVRRTIAERTGCTEPEPVEVVCIWCRYVTGKLRFHFGAKTAEQSFAGWTRRLKAPPVTCPATGTPTYHLTQTDDARIAAAERIAVCEETGSRVLDIDLETCELTGKRAQAGLLALCPVTGRRILAYRLLPCRLCGEEVDPECLENDICRACRRPAPVSADDPRIVRLTSEYPSLEKWGRWRLSETASLYIVSARCWLRQAMFVFDKDSLALRAAATGGRLASVEKLRKIDQPQSILETETDVG